MSSPLEEEALFLIASSMASMSTMPLPDVSMASKMESMSLGCK